MIRKTLYFDANRQTNEYYSVMDVHTKAQRSYNMSRIRGKNTKPEIALRKMIWASGLRGYRLHTTITGKPDIYFPRKKIAVFIDGCFWHGCRKCNLKPQTNKKFWISKIAENVKRDNRNSVVLRKNGIKVIRIKEHDIKRNIHKAVKRLIELL